MLNDALNGKILNIRLTTGEIAPEEIPAKMYTDFLRGSGPGAAPLLARLPKSPDAARPRPDPRDRHHPSGAAHAPPGARQTPGDDRPCPTYRDHAEGRQIRTRRVYLAESLAGEEFGKKQTDRGPHRIQFPHVTEVPGGG